MSTLYITEHRDLARAANGHITQVPGDYGTDQSPITISGTSAQSAAFGPGAKFIRVNTDTVCSIVFGNNPTATTSNRRLSANQTEFFSVVAGDKLAVISNT